MSATPEEYTAVRFRCPFCRKSYARRCFAGLHIAQCHHNPDVAGCWGCKHLDRGPVYSEPSCLAGEDPCIVEHIESKVVWAGALITGCDKWEAKR